MFDIPKAIEAISNVFKSALDFAETAKERQSETEIIKERKSKKKIIIENKRLKKAVNIAEKIFRIFFKYFDKLTKKDREKVEELIDEFEEND